MTSGGVAEDPLRCTVERDNALRIDSDDPVEDVVDHRAQPLFGRCGLKLVHSEPEIDTEDPLAVGQSGTG